jgi:hypothetical protein
MKRKWNKELTAEALEKEIALAKTAYKQAEATEPRAESVYYDRDSDLIVINLKNGARFSFPPKLAQGLENASAEQLSDVWVSTSGRSVHWDSLDADFSVANLVAGIFGTKVWMSELTKDK